MKRIGLVIAVKEEAAKILADGKYKWQKGENGVFKSQSFPLSLCITGIGKAYAVYGLSKILDDSDLILSMGTSGGLNDEKIGDIYVISEFVEHDMDVTGLGIPVGVTPFSKMKDAIISSCSNCTVDNIKNAISKCGIDYKKGRTISGDTFLCDAKVTEMKRDLFKAQLVDMESAAIAKICFTEANKEMIAVRYITDNANHESAGNWQENVEKSSVLFNKILHSILELPL